MEQEMNQKLDDILGIVTFIKDNGAMTEEMHTRFEAADRRFDRIENDLRAIRADILEIKERITKLEKRTLEDADAAAQDILELKQRIDELERKVTTLEHAQQPTPA